MKLFANVQSLTEATLQAGTITETKGYTTSGDGGGARYLIQTAAEFGGTPDEYGDHTLANGNVAVLQPAENGVPSIRQFGADGSADTAAFSAALASRFSEIAGVAGDTYEIDDTITVTDKLLDLRGAQLNYRGATDKFAVVAQTSAVFNNAVGFVNATVDCISTDTVNRTHGVNIGGSLTKAHGLRIQGFTGISLGLGSGVEAYTGVTLPASSQCYYCSIKDINVASTAGWNYVIPIANNSNYFSNISAFPYDGFSEVPPRTANCIEELIIAGTSNRFDRVSLEGSPSSNMLRLTATANQNVISGLYLEYSSNWATPPFPRIVAKAQSSANVVDPIRHPYENGIPVDDLGTGNIIQIRPAFYVNGEQVLQPSSSQNLILNGTFVGPASTDWSDFSTAGTPSFGTGAASGNSWRIDVVSGRVQMFQNLATAFGINPAEMDGETFTAGCYIKTDMTDVQLRVSSSSSNISSGLADGNWHFITTTGVLQSGAPSVQIINNSSGQTGYVEVSNVTCVRGTQALGL